jgi:uncharacterized protein YbjT (DUF2867 family)
MNDSHNAKANVLVVGATGKLGTAATKLLLTEGFQVRAMTREKQNAGHLAEIGAELFEADLRDKDSLGAACAGMDHVIASAHAILDRGANCPNSVDGQGHRDLIEAARETGVRHFSYVSARPNGADHPVDFFRIKFATEKYLKASGLEYSIISGPAFMETQHEVMGGTILSKQKAFVFGAGNMKANYVSVVDMARYLVWSLTDERLANRRLDVGGPENLTQNEVIDIYESVCGFSIKRSRLPVPLLKTLNFLVGPFHSVARRIFTMGALIATEDSSFDTSELLAEYPWQLRSYEESARNWRESEMPG